MLQYVKIIFEISYGTGSASIRAGETELSGDHNFHLTLTICLINMAVLSLQCFIQHIFLEQKLNCRIVFLQDKHKIDIVITRIYPDFFISNIRIFRLYMETN